MASETKQMPNRVQVNGFWFSKSFETNRPMADQLACIRNLDMRADDVLICASEKAGTHWIWEMASMLLRGKAEYNKETKEFAMMEAAEIEKTQSRPSPRLLNTHLPAGMLPAQVKEKKVKVIHIYRNVKDVVVSKYFHFKQHKDKTGITLDLLIDLVNNPGVGYIPFLLAMDKFIKENPDLLILNMSFEDVKEDPDAAVSRLARFLGVSVSRELCADIAKATAFTNLKQADEGRELPKHFNTSQMYRKGVVGDWKNHLTVAQSERLDAEMDKLKSCDFRFRYTL